VRGLGEARCPQAAHHGWFAALSEGSEDKIKNGADARPVLLNDVGRIALSAADLRVVSVVKRLLACDLALVLAGARYVGAPLNWAEGSVREREYVAPQVHLDGTGETVYVRVGDTGVGGRWSDGGVLSCEVNGRVLADTYVVGQSHSVQGAKLVSCRRVVIQEGDNAVCPAAANDRTVFMRGPTPPVGRSP
jgi:hypothetical protein